MAEHSPEPDQPAMIGTARRRKLRHRIPVRLRHYWKAAAVTMAGMLALVLVFGNTMVRPYITSRLLSDTTITNNIEGTTDLFNGDGHDIEITFDESEYDDMMQTYEDEGEKEYISADVTIDGTLIEDVALRLKGNSTLASLRKDAGGRGEGAPFENGREPPRQNQGGGRPGMPMTQLSEHKPEELPWLLSFNEFRAGRAYQGHTEIALRPGSAGSDTALNEALALAMTAQADQTTQDFTFTTVTVNDGEAAPRLLVDVPDPSWTETLGTGVLYKARAGGSFEYRGEDPTDYAESFNQINGQGSYDLQPVIDLLAFVEESDDAEFGRELSDHLDVEAFAEYLATQELISNWDAMDGPGNNYYLWYDTEDARFTVLSWDLNLALSGMGGGTPGAGADAKRGGREALPENMPEMPTDLPGGMPEMPGGGPGGEGAGGSGLLKERFLENDEFEALYEQAYADLYPSVIGNHFATETLADLADRAEAAGDPAAQKTADTLAKRLSTITKTPPDPTPSPRPAR